MGGRAIPRRAFCTNRVFKLVRPLPQSPPGWDAPPPGGVKCVSVAEANEIVTACKRLERENWRRARWELQHRFSAMRLGSSLSAVAKPFQPQATSSSMLVAGPPQGPVGHAGPREDSPAAAAIGTPVRRGSPASHQASDEGETSPDTSIPDRTVQEETCPKRK